MESGQALQHLVGVGASWPQAWQPAGLRIHPAAAGHLDQCGLRTDFQVALHTLRAQGLQAAAVAHRRADVPTPVLRVSHGSANRRMGDIGNDWYLRLSVANRGGKLPEFSLHRFHQGRVEGVGDPQPLCPDAAGGEGWLQGGDGLERPCDHHVARAVIRCDDQGRGLFSQQGLNGGCIREQGEHAPSCGQGFHQPTAIGDQPQSIVEIEHPSDAGCSHLPHAVAQQPVGKHAPTHPESRQGDLQGKEHRLGDAGLLEHGAQRRFRRIGFGAMVHDPPQRPALRQHLEAPEEVITVVDHLPEHGLGGQEFAAHARILRSLAGEEKGQGGRRGHLSGGEPVVAQGVFQVQGVAAHPGGSVGQVAAAQVGAVAEIGQIQWRSAGGEKGCVAHLQLLQGSWALG